MRPAPTVISLSRRRRPSRQQLDVFFSELLCRAREVVAALRTERDRLESEGRGWDLGSDVYWDAFIDGALRRIPGRMRLDDLALQIQRNPSLARMLFGRSASWLETPDDYARAAFGLMHPLMHQYADNVPDLTDNPVELERAVSLYRSFLMSPRFDIWLFAALSGVVVPDAPIQLTRAVQLVRLLPDDREELERRYRATRAGVAPSVVADAIEWGVAARIAVSVNRKKPRFMQKRAHIQLDRALTGLCLVTNEDVGSPLVWVSVGRPNARFAHYHLMHDHVWTGEKASYAGSVTLDDSLVGAWRAATDGLENVALHDARFSDALAGLRRSYGRTDQSDRLLDAWTGLERLFAPGRTKVTRTLATRVSDWLGETEAERSTVRDSVVSSYNDRGGLVHGRLSRDEAGAAANVPVGLLRQALLRCVEAGRLPSISGPNADMN